MPPFFPRLFGSCGIVPRSVLGGFLYNDKCRCPTPVFPLNFMAETPTPERAQVDSDQPTKFSPADVLPAVEPPSVTFLLQLFLIPLLIVSIIVAVWMMFSWAAQSGTSPREMAREIAAGGSGSWQRAVTLAQLLSSRDASAEKLKDDPEFCKSMADVLSKELKTQLTDSKEDQQRIQSRVFLARVLGEFRTFEGLPTLLEAATHDESDRDINVRLAALEGLAIFASNVGPEKLRDNAEVMKTLELCSHATDENTAPIPGASADYRPRGEIRGAAAYAMGVIGGKPALDRLADMLDDPYPNVRYNATSGLCRSGDPRAVKGLKEMLKPDNTQAGSDERHETEREAKRLEVLRTGIESAKRWNERRASDVDPQPVIELLKTLSAHDLSTFKTPGAKSAIQALARETVLRIEKSNTP
jgi:hypothetical protein